MTEKRRQWTKPEIDLLIELYPGTETRLIAEAVGHPCRSVYHKANEIGLRKDKDYFARIRKVLLHGVGIATRFNNGHTPWNKGLKGIKVSASTCFKPGNRPHNWHPIGYVRQTKDGYLQRKIADTRCTRRDYVSLHILCWREHHGDIPKGMVVAFKNGDKTDIHIDNLALISKAELMTRNSIDRYPDELKSAIRLVSKLKRKIKERHEKQDR